MECERSLLLLYLHNIARIGESPNYSRSASFGLSSLFRFTVCGLELICATSIIGKLLTRNKQKDGRRR
jgi:hypothetical protein